MPMQSQAILRQGQFALGGGASVPVSPNPIGFSEKSILMAPSKVENLETQGHCQEGVRHSHT